MSGPVSLSKKRGLLSWALRLVLPIVVFSYAYALLFQPLADPDLFWHLKTGQWTLDHRELPGHGDPFSYTSPKTLSKGQVEGLRSQWLGQVVLYLVYALGGYPGLVVFRSMMILAPFLIAYYLALRRGLSPVWGLLLVSLPVFLIALSLHYTFERPQAFTILLSFALVPLLGRMRRPEGRWKWALLMAFVMALWSNLHGGFIFGVVMMAAYAAGVAAEAALGKDWAGLKTLPPVALGVAATLLNPNAYSLLYSFISAHAARLVGGAPPAASLPGKVDVVGELLEYKPLWFFYEKLHFIWPLYIMAFIALAAVIMAAGYISRKRVDLPVAFVAALVVVFSFYYSRGATIALVVLPMLAAGEAGAMGKLWRFSTGAASAVLCASLLFVTVQRSPWQLRPQVPPAEWVDSSYPEGAVEFIKDNGVQGPMFNEFRWGGYLMWELYPAQQVFIDGRIISDAVLEAQMFIMKAGPGALKQLDAFGVNYVIVQPVSRETGVITPLVLRFLQDRPDGWRLVYMGGNSALFVRNVPRNADLIARYGLPYEALCGPIYAEAQSVLNLIPGNANAALSMAIALAELQRDAEAAALLNALPPSPVRDRYLGKIKEREKVSGEDREGG